MKQLKFWLLPALQLMNDLLGSANAPTDKRFRYEKNICNNASVKDGSQVRVLRHP